MKKHRQRPTRRAKQSNPLADISLTGEILDIAITGLLVFAGLEKIGVKARAMPDGTISLTWPPDMDPFLRTWIERFIHARGNRLPMLDTIGTGLIIAGLQAHGVDLAAMPGGDLRVTFAGPSPELNAALEAWLREPDTTRALYAAMLMVQREQARTGGIGRG